MAVALTVHATDVEDLALGATVLGGGGGGDTWLTKAMLYEAIRRSGPLTVHAAETIADDALVVAVGIVGAPAAIVENFPGAIEVTRALSMIEDHVGRRCEAIFPLEIGGMNALFPLAAGHGASVKCIDADAMGRAMPHIGMALVNLAGRAPNPIALASCWGNDALLKSCSSGAAEAMVRTCLREMGLVAAIATYPMEAHQLRSAGAGESVSFCLELGRKLSAVSSVEDHEAYDAFLKFVRGRTIFEGDVVHVRQPVVDPLGGLGGSVVLKHNRESRRFMRVEFDTENVVASEEGQAVVTAPDIIIALHRETARPVSVENISVGDRVQIVGIPAHDRWRTAEGIALSGPRARGYDLDYVDLAGR